MATYDSINAEVEAMTSALGKFVWNFNEIEDRFNYALGLLLDPADAAKGEIVGATLMFRQKIQMTRALVDHHCDEEATEDRRSD